MKVRGLRKSGEQVWADVSHMSRPLLPSRGWALLSASPLRPPWGWPPAPGSWTWLPAGGAVGMITNHLFHPICLFFNSVFSLSSLSSQKAGNKVLTLNRDPRSRLLGQAPVAERGADLGGDTCQLAGSLRACPRTPCRTSVPRDAGTECAAALSRAEQAGSPAPGGSPASSPLRGCSVPRVVRRPVPLLVGFSLVYGEMNKITHCMFSL